MMDLAQARTAAAVLAGRVRIASPGIDPARLPNGMGLAHALYMLDCVAQASVDDKPMGEGKAMRWLGYAQAMLVYEGCDALDAMKETNRAATYDDLVA